MKLPFWLRALVAPYLLDLLTRVRLSAADRRRLTDPDGVYRLADEQVAAVEDAFRRVVAERVGGLIGVSVLNV